MLYIMNIFIGGCFMYVVMEESEGVIFFFEMDSFLKLIC